MTSNYDQLIVCRFLQGIGLGGEIPVASTYISEILRADRRGGRFLTYQIIFPVGIVDVRRRRRLGGAALRLAMDVRHRRATGIVALVMQRVCPESPRWLASQGRLDEADTIVTGIERHRFASRRAAVAAGAGAAVQPLGQQDPLAGTV